MNENPSPRRAQIRQAASSDDRSSASFEPIAIIGMGCRFPGECDSLESYWDLLAEGRSAITRTPESRWSLQKFYTPEISAPGKTQSQWGGYVRDIEQFDPSLFGISPREAAAMDPQQRMLLEVAWRSIEDAGQRIENLAGKQVSVYVGISSFDYAVAGLSFEDRGVIGPYNNTGGSSSIAANRISYCFDFRGPSVAVDTACSSSLVAVHHACQSLLHGEAEMALAGGVNSLLLPDFYVAFSQLGVLSPTGSCKTFDAAADGYVRSEGAGMVLLRRLSDAIRDGDPIHAVIRASALNQDGRTQGMTVPSRDAQESLMRKACALAGITPNEIQYVEAHGTGTPVGDPIEATALSAVAGAERNEPCLIGSVKTNLGHLEAGAGIASLIKVALSLKHSRIPAHLHFQNPNPQIDFEMLNLKVPTKTQPWPSAEAERIAGINGFGYGGANAHLLVSEAPSVGESIQSATPSLAATSLANQSPEKESKTPLLIPISARNESAIGEVAELVQQMLVQTTDKISLRTIAANLSHHRSHQECRASVVAENRDQAVQQLKQLVDDPTSISEHRLSPSALDKGLLFVCSGQGPQWWAMGRGLLQENEVFRAAIERCDREFAKYVDWSLIDELTQDESSSRLNQTEIAQPCIFALQVALAEVWNSMGIVPSAIVGHSVGEIAAAHLSGALTWQDACCVAIHRGRTMDLASSRGAMIAVGLSPSEVRPYLTGHEDEVSVAAINGPTSITVSGDVKVIDRLAKRIDDEGIFCRKLQVEYAFHSPQMAPVEEALTRALANIVPQPTHTPMISTVHAGWIDGEKLNANYWWHNVRDSVRFADAMTIASDSGFAIALEIGPHPVLSFAMTECYQSSGRPIRVFPSLHRERSDMSCMMESLGSLYCLGINPDWNAVAPRDGQRLQLPEYPFQRQSLWSESLQSTSTRLVSDFHPLLGQDLGRDQWSWSSRIDLKLQRYLGDHTVRGNCVVPAAAIIEMATNAAIRVSEKPRVTLEKLHLHKPLLLDHDHPKKVTVRFDEDRNRLFFSSALVEESNWTSMADVGISNDHSGVTDWQPRVLESAEDRCTESVSAERCYSYCQQIGLSYGESFQGVTHAVRRNGEAVVTVSTPIDPSGYCLHPATLDSCFHGMIIADRDFDTDCRDLYLPRVISRIDVFRPFGSELKVHVRILLKDAHRMVADIDIVDESGEQCVSIRGFESVRVAAVGKPEEQTEDLIYRYVWTESDLGQTEKAVGERNVCVFSDQSGLGAALIQGLTETCGTVMVQHGPSYRKISERSFVIDPENRSDFVRLLNEVPGLITDIVYLWGLDTPDANELTAATLEKSTIFTALAPMHLIAAWQQVNESSEASMTIVLGTDPQSSEGRQAIRFVGKSSEGRQAIRPDQSPHSVSVAQGPLLGFGRVIISECSRLKSKIIELPIDSIDVACDTLVNEVLATADVEDEILYRDGERFGRRFLPQRNRPLEPSPQHAEHFQLRTGESVGIGSLRYELGTRQKLGDHDVEIEVAATGLNFSDVMKALGLYPGLPDGAVDLGAECSGKITSVGKSVTDWNVGDQVIAIAPGSFGKTVTVGEDLIARWPKTMTAEQAAAMPIAFLTADYALNHCARIRKGESVLIHSATGGVGLAAIQIAKKLGVKVFATAGTDVKRDHLRSLGIEHPMDSRSLSFANETLRATDGEGVDAILNSLPGEAIEKGLSILKTGGRFLEIGKRDIYADRPLGLEPLKNNLAFFAIDLDQLFKQQPARMGKMLRELVEQFESGELEPPPTKSYGVDEARDAFRFMQKARHVGKVAVKFDDVPSELHAGKRDEIQFSPDGTYWIAGGLGGFGIETARWLVERGAGHLVLGGRRANLPQNVESQIDALRKKGAQIEVIPADITRRDDVDRVLETIDERMPPLKAVFHTAMILEDKMIADLDRETLERVLRPKVLGGWNLHQATLDRGLDYFVLFSSLSSVFGHAGQANYAAANAFLDSLAHLRRSIGLPATVINWGHLGEVGYLAQREQLGKRLERQGVLSFTVAQAMDCLEYALQNESLQMSVLRMDWSLWRGLGITSQASPRFAHLIVSRTDSSEISVDQTVSAAQIRAADPKQRVELIRSVILNKTAALLGTDLSDIETHRPLVEMGLDSLMAVELRNWIESRVEVDLPISKLMRSGSIEQLAESVGDEIDGSQDSGSQPKKNEMSEVQAEELLDQIDDLADEEVDELLKQMMDEGK